MRRVVLIGLRYPDLSIEREALGDLEVDLRSVWAETPEEIIQAAAGADVIIAGSRPRFDESTLSRLRCRALVRAGIGVDSIDLDAARRLGYTVANVPDYGTEAVAFHTLTLVVAGLRRLIQADEAVKAGGWGLHALRPLHLPSALTAGVVGLGRIGRRVAELLRAVGFGEVQGYDPYTEPPPGVTSVAFEDLLETSDVVTLHVPSGRIMGREELDRMKEGSLLVNTARGGLVDTEALVEGLRRGRPALAALDVFEAEPPDLTLVKPVLDRLVLTPHMAWYTEESEASLRKQAAEEARRLLTGQLPVNPVVIPEES